MEIFIINEIAYSWKKDIKTVIGIFMITLIGIFLMGLLIILNIETDEQIERYQEIYEDIQYYGISDNFVGDNLYEMEDAKGLVKLQRFLQLLKNSEYFEYFMIYLQPVYIADYKGDRSNIQNYEIYADAEKKATIELKGIDGKVRKMTNMKSIWVGDNVFEQFDIKIQEGKGFTSEDFYLQDGTISVVLGSNYSQDYSIGEYIYVDFIFAERQAKIIGFLEEGSNLYYNSDFISLDKYVIMPIFLNDTYNGKSVYKMVNHFYTIRNGGLLATKLSVQDAQNIIHEYSEKAGFESGYYVKEYFEKEQYLEVKQTFSKGMETIEFLIQIVVILAIVFIVVLLSICYINRIRQKESYYAILLINGCNRRQIFTMIFQEMFTILITTYIVDSVFISVLFRPEFENIIKILSGLFVCTCLFGIVPIIISALVFFHMDLIAHVKEEV